MGQSTAETFLVFAQIALGVLIVVFFRKIEFDRTVHHQVSRTSDSNYLRFFGVGDWSSICENIVRGNPEVLQGFTKLTGFAGRLTQQIKFGTVPPENGSHWAPS
jgi:hypothetical protein